MPVVTTYTATIELDVPCLVHCKNCDCRFVYERRFSGTGQAGTVMLVGQDRTRQVVEKRARDDLAEMLSHLDIYAPVPCPQCFHYQPYMFSQVGYARYDNIGCVCYPLIFLGLVLLVGAIAYAVNWSTSALAIGLAATGGVLWLVSWLMDKRRDWLVTQYNPNEEKPLDERKRVADARAILLPEYDARQTARIGNAYQKYLAANAGPGKREPLVTEWWLPSSVFVNGGTFSIVLPDDERFTVRVSDDAKPGDVVDASPTNPQAEPLRLRLRLLEMRVHPDELRLE
ncbi:MAG TPA: hypothetical protein VKE74_09395 [Gemmataceae bacterium]|nr:hypothetical protein [Gemmataceae bacterium]